MRASLRIAVHELKLALRQRETWLWTFVMPVVFFYFLGAMQGGMDGGSGKDELVLQAPADAGFFADTLEKRLAERDFAVERVTAAPAEAPDRRLELASGFTDGVLAGEKYRVRFERDEGGNAASFDSFRVGRAVYSLLADVVALRADEREVTAAALDDLAAQPRSLSVDVRLAGERRRIPSGHEHSLPGSLAMFTLIVLLTSGAIGVVIDRRQGLLRRLAAAPISRGQIVFGRWLGILALGLVQIGFGVLIANVLFDVDWGPDPLMVGAVLLAWGAFSTSLALCLSSLFSTEAQVVGAGVLASNVLAALGGCWWPIEVTPSWMQALASWLPTGWVMNALHELMFFASGPSGALRSLALLVLGALALGALAAKRFRFQ